MKYLSLKTLTLLAFAVLALLVVAPTQVIADDTGEQRAFAAVADGQTLSTQEFREEVAQSIRQAAEDSKTLSRAQKRRIERVMRGGWFHESRKNAIIDDVTKKLYAEQQIVVVPDGVQAAVDWNAIIGFIERLMPLILQLITLFGG